MVKIPTKSKIATPPKNVSTFKAAKKSEKPKTKGVSKPKVTLVVNKRVDAEQPCSSKQAAGNSIGGASSCKTDTKNSWAISCATSPEQVTNKEQLLQQATSVAAATTTATPHSITTTTQATTTTTTIAAATTTLTTTATVNAAERADAADNDAETQSKFRSGVRYSDVLRSKNVSSSGSVKPILTCVPMPPQNQLILSPHPQANDIPDIDLTLFPELGQHTRNCPSSNAGSTSVRLLQRTQATADEDDSSQATLEALEPNFNGTDNNNNNNNNSININNINMNNNSSADSNNGSTAEEIPEESEHAPPSTNCPQCALNSLWVQHALFNSAQPYHMEIPEFNFLRADQNYPRFLGQFEDENYLKTENLALLGLKLALGGNFHSMHSNNGR